MTLDSAANIEHRHDCTWQWPLLHFVHHFSAFFFAGSCLGWSRAERPSVSWTEVLETLCLQQPKEMFNISNFCKSVQLATSTEVLTCSNKYTTSVLSTSVIVPLGSATSCSGWRQGCPLDGFWESLLAEKLPWIVRKLPCIGRHLKQPLCNHWPRACRKPHIQHVDQAAWPKPLGEASPIVGVWRTLMKPSLSSLLLVFLTDKLNQASATPSPLWCCTWSVAKCTVEQFPVVDGFNGWYRMEHLQAPLSGWSVPGERFSRCTETSGCEHGPVFDGRHFWEPFQYQAQIYCDAKPRTLSIELRKSSFCTSIAVFLESLR